MAGEFRDVQDATGPSAVGVISTGQLVTEEFYALGKLVQLGLGTRNYDGNTTLCMSTAVAGYKRSFGSDGPPGAYEDFEKRRRHPADRREHRREPSDSLPAPARATRHDADRRRPARDEDGDDGGPASAGRSRASDLALINGIIHIVIEHDLIDHDYIAAAHDRLRRAARVGPRRTRPSASPRSPASRRS